MKIINCKNCEAEFKVKNKNTKFKYCENCRKDKNLNFSIYRARRRKEREKVNYYLKHFKITFTGDIGYSITFKKYKKIGNKEKLLKDKNIYLEFIEELQQQLQEEKENILKW